MHVERKAKTTKREFDFVEENNLSVLTDLYELTMCASYFDNKRNELATFDLFIRKLPANRSFFVFAGLEQALLFLKNMRFNSDQIEYLRKQGFKNDFLDYLRGFSFTGEVWAIPEGTIVFENNLYYKTGNLVRYKSSDYTSSNISSIDSKKVVGNPLFVSASDFHLSANSPAIDAGTNLGTPYNIDADGLNNLSKLKDWHKKVKAKVVLTPHPGEMRRLWKGIFDSNPPTNRQEQAGKFAEHTKTTVVLKGAGTIVTDGERVYVNNTGNPGMATAGSGDVLTGVIAAFMGQSFSNFDAAVLGVYIHGLAGDMAAARQGPDGITAEDILECLPRAVRRYRRRSGRPESALNGRIIPL